MSSSSLPSTLIEELRRQAEELQTTVSQVKKATAQQDEHVRSLQQEIVELKQALAEKEDSSRLTTELKRLQEDHQYLRERIHSPRFWTEEFVRPFAMGLQNLNAVQRELAVDHPEELAAVFQRWQHELGEGLTALSSGPHDEETAERLRRLLLVQWVYLQWMSITHAVGAP